jgi:lysophospholipase L1-like esterase
MIIKPQSKILFIGASVTDCGRDRTVGQNFAGATSAHATGADAENADATNALGNGYVCFIDALLGSQPVEYSSQIVNKGISGDTSRDVRARWQRDVLDLQPDWVSLMVGVNDIWRRFDSPQQPELGVPLDEYQANIRDVVQRTRPHVEGFLLAAPFFLEPSHTDEMRVQFDLYHEVLRTIAREEDVIYVDIQAAFDAVLETRPSTALAPDRIHPNHIGHMITARAWLEVVGFRWGK